MLYIRKYLEIKILNQRLYIHTIQIQNQRLSIHIIIIILYTLDIILYDFSYDFSRKIINIIKIVNELIIYLKAAEIISVINSYFILNTIIITFVVIKLL